MILLDCGTEISDKAVDALLGASFEDLVWAVKDVQVHSESNYTKIGHDIIAVNDEPIPNDIGAAFTVITWNESSEIEYVVMARKYKASPPDFVDTYVDDIQSGREVALQQVKEYLRKHIA